MINRSEVARALAKAIAYKQSGRCTMKPSVIVTQDGVEAPADWLNAQGNMLATQMIDGNHAGFNAMLQCNPHADPLEIMESMLNQAYNSWVNVGKFAGGVS